MPSSKVSQNEFIQIIAEALIVNPENLTENTHFINDLGVDSIRLVELYLRFQELGLDIPQDAIWKIQTIGDAYRFYLKQK